MYSGFLQTRPYVLTQYEIILVPVELFSAIVTKHISLYNYYARDNRPAPGSIGHTYLGPSYAVQQVTQL